MAEQKLSKSILLLYLFSYLGAPFGYLIKILYASSFSIQEFGLIYAIIGFFTLISVFNDFGFSETLNYYGVKFYEKKNFRDLSLSFYYAIFMQLISAILLLFIVYFMANFLMHNYFKSSVSSDILLYFLPYFIFINLSVPLRLIFNINEKYYFNSFFMFIQFLLTYLLSLLFIFYKFPLKYIGLTWTISSFILILVYIYLIYKHFAFLKKIRFEFDFKLYKKLFKYAISVLIGSAAILILSKIDIIFVTYFLNLKSVGLYEIAFSLSTISSLALLPILSLVAPLTTKYIEQKKLKKLNNFITLLYKIFIILGLPLTLVLVIFSKYIILILFSQTYQQAQPLLIILSIGFFFTIFNSVNFYILAGLGKLKSRNIIMYISSFLIIILNYIFMKIFGLKGIAIATSLIYLFMFISSFILIHNYKIKVRFNILFYLKIIFSNLIFLLSIYILKRNLFLNIYIKIFLVVSISFAIYIVLIFLLKIIEFDKLKKLLLGKI